MTVETCSHYELLHRVAERKGWRVLLRSNLDHDRAGDTLTLTTLDVQERVDGEWDLLARADLTRAGVRRVQVKIDDAARIILSGLHHAGFLERGEAA